MDCRSAARAKRRERGSAQAESGGTTADRRASVQDRKSTRLNSSHLVISYAVFCLKKKKTTPSNRSKYPASTPPSPLCSPLAHHHSHPKIPRTPMVLRHALDPLTARPDLRANAPRP